MEFNSATKQILKFSAAVEIARPPCEHFTHGSNAENRTAVSFIHMMPLYGKSRCFPILLLLRLLRVYSGGGEICQLKPERGSSKFWTTRSGQTVVG